MKLLLLLLCLCCQPAGAQFIKSQPMDFFADLPSNEVFVMHQDREGYLWIGTSGGLSRYDGRHIVSFRCDWQRPHLLQSNAISSLTDNGQFVFIGTRKGLNLYNKRTRRISAHPDSLLASRDITALATAPDGSVWAGTGDGLVARCSADGLSVEIQRPNGNNAKSVNCLYFDSRHRLWALTDGGLFRTKANGNILLRQQPLAPGVAAYTLFEDRAHHYYIGTWGHGLYQYFPDQAPPHHCRPLPLTTNQGTPEDIVYSIQQDNALGLVWLLTYNELHALRPEADGWLTPVDVSGAVDTDKMYTRIMRDTEGSLWLSAYDSPRTVFFCSGQISNYPCNLLEPITSQKANLVSLCPAAGGAMYLSQDRHGLYHYQPETNTITSLGAYTGEVSLLTPTLGGRCVWAASRYHTQLFRFDGPGKPVETCNFLAQHPEAGTVTAMTESAGGSLFILAENGIYRKPAHTPRVNRVNVKGIFSAMAADADGRITALTHNGVVVSLDAAGKPLSRHATTGLTAPPAMMAVDALGRIWVATTLGRMLCSDKARRHFSPCGMDALTANATILNVIAEDNYVWIVTHKAIIRRDILRGTTEVHTAEDVDMGVSLFRGCAAATDGQGGLYAGGLGGYIYLSGAKPAENKVLSSHKPEVSDVICDGKSLYFDPQTATGKAVLPSSQRTVELHIASFCYSPSHSVELMCRVEGADNRWREVDARGGALTYSRLTAGKHAVRLRWRNEQGLWQEHTALVINRQPTLIETGWVQLLLLVLAAGLLFIGVKALLGRTRRINEQLWADSTEMLHIRQYLTSDTPEASPEVESLNALLARRATEAIRQGMADADFSVDALAEAMNMSRSTLTRKLRAITGNNPADLIRNERLARATELLRQGRTVAEVAYAVGFSSPKYFTKCYKEKFGVTPNKLKIKN